MHALVSILTAATLLIHALFGCCWQYSHSCTDCQKMVAEAKAPAGCCKHHHCKSQQEQKPSEPCKCKLECKGVCTYLPPEKTVIDDLQLSAPFDFLAIVPALSDDHQVAASFWEQACGPPQAEPSLRLHLLHQIFLI